MFEFSIGDDEFFIGNGFVELKESFGDMIKYVANEPSVGLYYIQQHAQNAVPNVCRLKRSISERSREALLQAEDLEDSTDMICSMKECGYPIAEEMIGDIKKSLAIMSTKQPIRGVIRRNSSSFWMGKGSSSWGPGNWTSDPGGVFQNDAENMGSGYLSGVFKTARQKAESFRWPQLDLMELRDIKRERSSPSLDILEQTMAGNSGSVQVVDGEGNEVAVHKEVGLGGARNDLVDGKIDGDGAISEAESYDGFKTDKEAKLEEWLGDDSFKADKEAKLEEWFGR